MGQNFMLLRNQKRDGRTGLGGQIFPALMNYNAKANRKQVFSTYRNEVS
jgi:hypothetical protein